MQELPGGTVDQFSSAAHFIARVIEVVGIGVMVLGALGATLAFLYRFRRARPFEDVYHLYRTDLGRAILLGLEFLVAADIIGTVAVEPTFRSLGVLGLIVLIRTFLSFSLEVEITGRLPWKGDHPSTRERAEGER